MPDDFDPEEVIARGGAIEIESPWAGSLWYTTNPEKARSLRRRGLVVYEPHEVNEFEHLLPEERRHAHRTKLAFGGILLRSLPGESTP